ncbi:MAG: tetratricopeptide repeat protein [Nitrospira sp.]|nr:tetratricopeptide repeat protein [Nitrospira sp.]
MIAGLLLASMLLYTYQNRYTLQAIFYDTLQNRAEAIKSLEKSVSYRPGAYAYYQLGLNYKAIKDYEKAEAVYLKLLELFPNHPYANYDLGFIYRETGRFDEAIVQYEKALQIDPENLYALSDIGYVYKERGQLQKAMVQYQKVLQYDPSQKYALWDIAVLYEELGMPDEAEKQYLHYHDMTDCSLRRFWNCLD